jgi:hypothetical protein
MSNVKDIYNIGTAVHYAGDNNTEGGFGTITDTQIDLLGELTMEITLESGEVVDFVTPGDFETGEFHMVDEGGSELQSIPSYVEEFGFQGLIGSL